MYSLWGFALLEINSYLSKKKKKVWALPASYMGLPLGVPHNSVVVWDGIEERFKNRLSLWKRQYIFEGGRLTLIRSTLSCLLVYPFSSP